MDNVRAAIARIASIEVSITGRNSASARTAGAPAAAGGDALVQSIFARALQQAHQTTLGPERYGRLSTTAQLTPAAGTRYAGAPPGLEMFANGTIPEELLAPISGTHERLWAPAAAAFEHMRANAAADGVALPIIDAYRPHHDQVRLANELGLYSEGGRAAEPGTSEHGWGRALDLDVDDQAVGWLRKNAWKYGYVETVKREPWHWEFHPAR